MLVLSRKLMEKLYIGDEICITVVRLEGGQVRLGIEAPRHIPVVRAELSHSRRRSANVGSSHHGGGSSSSSNVNASSNSSSNRHETTSSTATTLGSRNL